MTTQWFLYNVMAIHKSLHEIGSHITDRALYPFIFAIYSSAFYPENYQTPILSGLWENTVLSTSIKGAQTRITIASLIYIPFALAGLISFIVEDLYLLPNQKRLQPLMGGKVVHYSWRDTLISHCRKRKRQKNHRIRVDEILCHLCRVQEFDGASESPTTYSNEKISTLVQSLDILEMNSLLEMFNTHRSPMRKGFQAEVARLHAITRSHEDPVLSPMESLMYNSVIPQVVMESVYLSKDKDSMPIVIDTGASRLITPHKSDFIEFKTHDMSIGTINASSKVEGTGMIRWKVTDQNGETSIIETAAYYIPTASIRLYSPQYHFRESCGGSLRMDNVGLHLTLPLNRRKPALSFPYNSVNNLPLMLLSHHPHFASAMYGACPSGDEIHAAINKLHPILKDVPVVEHYDLITASDTVEHLLMNGDHRANLSSAQLELRMFHNKMGHVHMKRIQRLVHHNKPLDSQQSEGDLNPPVVFRSRFAKTKTCSMPLCRSCALSKTRKQKTNTQHIIPTIQLKRWLSRGSI